jgi:hypothetical protein
MPNSEEAKIFVRPNGEPVERQHAPTAIAGKARPMHLQAVHISPRIQA